MQCKIKLVGFLLATTAACSLEKEPKVRPNQIVFGISQAAEASGLSKISVASFSVVSLDEPQGFLEEVREPGRACFLEDLELRPGTPRTESGTATFHGGSLPAAGLRLEANGSVEAQHDGPAWRTNDMLTFESNGFAAPPLRRTNLPTPSVDLRVHDPVQDGTLRRGAPFVANWEPIEGAEKEQIVFSLRADESDQDISLRCYFDPAAGTGTMPASALSRFLSSLPRSADGTTRFRARIASARQITAYPGDDWAFTVVASTVHRLTWIHVVD